MRRTQGQTVTIIQVCESAVIGIILFFTGFLCFRLESGIAAAGVIVAGIVLTVALKLMTTKKTEDVIHWYESLLDAIPFPISVTDMDMNWTFINKPVEGMLGISRHEVMGKHCSNWGAGICNTSNCGITCLRNGKNQTAFEQMGLDFQVDIAYIQNKNGKHIGHIEVVQDITKMVETQKAQAKLVNEINGMCSAFVSATDGISSGSQALAQGSVEQAASVEELSASIAEISSQIDTNTQQVGQAAELAKEIQRDAEKGSEQMTQMMQAVREISEAGKSIEKVMKVIDDIAFQTNILALNAAVEAARAGQHGKGFAVVADEVRSLASKSAEAAKDTGALIANSIEKSNLGAQISVNTASSLEKIIDGIKKSSEIITKVAESSSNQNVAIKQINAGIEQVSQVVQQNSATAQQSAAASHELNDQTNMLKNLLAGFNSGAGSGKPQETGMAANI